MSLNVTFNGVMYIVPETGEVGWGGNTTSYLVAIAAGALQKTGGSFTLSAETDFGASFGLKSLYYKSRSTNVATTGILRLANNSDSISFRNAANSADLALTVNASNELLYNGNQVLTGTGPSSYVSSITGTANQVNASASTGAVTLSLPQSINTSAAVQFGTLALGSTLSTSAIMSLASTTLGFLPPRMTTAQRDAIVTPATGLLIYNTTNNQYDSYNGSAWVALAMSGGGTVNAGTQYQLGYYAANGTSISGLPLITGSRALASDANGLPVASAVTSTELGYVSGVTSAIQTQLNGKEPTISTLPISKGGTNSSTALVDNRIMQSLSGAIVEAAAITASRALISDVNGIPTHSTVTSTELSYVSGVTSAIQTQFSGKAATDLSNLSSVAINASLISASNNTHDLGSSSLRFRTAYLGTSFNLTGAAASIAGSIVNTSTSANSEAFLNLQTDSAATGAADAYVQYLISGGGSFTSGVDNSDGDSWVLSRAGGPGTNNAIRVDGTSGAVAIRGTNTNDSATAGFVGETVQSVVSFTNFPSTATFGDLTSISLTAGDWSVSLFYAFELNGATVTAYRTGISSTSGNSGSGLTEGDNVTIEIGTPRTQENGSIAAYRISLASTTTFYFKYRADYSVATPRLAGRLTATRIR